jgi:hypothetical protein
MKKLVKWLFGTQNKQLDIPVVMPSVLCDACRLKIQDHKVKAFTHYFIPQPFDDTNL